MKSDEDIMINRVQSLRFAPRCACERDDYDDDYEDDDDKLHRCLNESIPIAPALWLRFSGEASGTTHLRRFEVLYPLGECLGFKYDGLSKVRRDILDGSTAPLGHVLTLHNNRWDLLLEADEQHEVARASSTT